MNGSKSKDSFPLEEKFCLTVSEASRFFGIGEKSLRRFIRQHEDADFLLKIGARTVVKKDRFRQYLDEQATVI